MKSHVSALMDGELEVHELPPVLDALSRNERLRAEWREYRLIGDAIRQEVNLDVDLTASVMAVLQNEPTVLAPARTPTRSRRGQWRGAMALAASIAGVSVVAWMAISSPVGSIAPVPAPIAAVAPRQTTTARDQSAPNPSGRMQEYLVAHQTYAPGGQMQSGTRYIRTVAAER